MRKSPLIFAFTLMVTFLAMNTVLMLTIKFDAEAKREQLALYSQLQERLNVMTDVINELQAQVATLQQQQEVTPSK